MSTPFRFLSDIPYYQDTPGIRQRLAQRHRLLVDPFAEQIFGARVLDLGCHDGRWSYALAQAGARRVVGVEARKDLVRRFRDFPEGEIRDRVELKCEDLFTYLEKAVENRQGFDVVALFGILYHVMDHQRLLDLISRLSPQLIIIDSKFITVDNAMIQLLWERTDNPLNTVGRGTGAARSVVGVPSHKAMEFMAEAAGYDTTWTNAGLILGDARQGTEDYFRDGRKVRGTCALTPRGSG